MASNRRERLAARLAEAGTGAILVSQAENRLYLSGFTGSAGVLVITPGRSLLATDSRYTEQAAREAPGYEIFRTTGDLADWLPGLALDLGITSLGFEADDITFAVYRRLTEALKKASSKLTLVPTSGLVASLRAVKETGELEQIIAAVRLADRAFEHIRDTVRAGMTEAQVAWEIERYLREHGSEAVPFELIVAAGPNAALPHARPSVRPIVAGEPVIIDIGARIGGYASDLSRTIWVGEAPPKLIEVYDTVLGAQLAALAIAREGMTGEEVDGLARAVIGEAGYGEAFGHGLGHGVGLATHELPRLGPKSTDRLADGMVFTIEPGIYLPGWGGVRIEDMAVMENGRPRVITGAKKVYD